MIIRRVRDDDDMRIAEIIRGIFVEYGMPKTHTVYDDPDTDRQYEVFRDEPRSVLWVAEKDGVLLGMCGVYPTAGLPQGWCEIVKFYVLKEARGKGLGNLLLDKSLHSALRLGYKTAYLETFPQFAKAVSMYKRFGFRQIDRQLGASGHTATSIWMTKALTEFHFDDDDMKWRILQSDNIIHRPHLDVYKEKVELPSGKKYDDFYHLHYLPFVSIVAETRDGKLLIERQYRNAVREVLTEIPAGNVEEGEEPLDAARRELLEETGFGGGEWKQLSVEYPQGGIQDNKMYTFYAKGVSRIADRHLDSTEDIRVYQVDKEEVLGMLVGGDICQAPQLNALWRYFVLYTDLLKQ